MSPEHGDDLTALLEHVRRERGIDFTSYKRSTLERRIGNRVLTLGLTGYQGYLDYLQAAPEELGPLLDAMFINVTRFFRDAKAWETLRAGVIPTLAERISPGEVLRVWCAGVASGEEAYTVAMLLAEEMGERRFGSGVRIFATDLDAGALAHARAAVYSDADLADVPSELRAKYFESAGGRHEVRRDLRRSVIFGRHDLLVDAPISSLHLLVCRNLLMYFNRAAQGRVLARFHVALRPDGYLFMGRAEMLLAGRDLFRPVDGAARLFRRVGDVGFGTHIQVVSRDGGEEEEGNPGMQETGVTQRRDRARDGRPAAYEELESANDALEMANEELNSTVDELATTNEELQSTNEQLQAMNEELQSTNAEMEAVNEELRQRRDEVAALSLHTRSILDGLGMVAVVLDCDLRVRTWSAGAETLWGLPAVDAEREDFAVLDLGLPVHDLRALLSECVSGESARGERTLPGHDREGKPVSHEVVCVPLRSAGRSVIGLIVLVNPKEPARAQS